MTEPFLFVYGTLRTDSQSPAGLFLRDHAALVGPAKFQGRRFLIDDYPGAVPSDDPTDTVLGDPYALKTPGSVLA